MSRTNIKMDNKTPFLDKQIKVCSKDEFEVDFKHVLLYGASIK